MLKPIKKNSDAVKLADYFNQTTKDGEKVHISDGLIITKLESNTFEAMSWRRYTSKELGMLVLFPQRKIVNAWIRQQIAREVNQEWAAEAAANEG